MSAAREITVSVAMFRDNGFADYDTVLGYNGKMFYLPFSRVSNSEKIRDAAERTILDATEYAFTPRFCGFIEDKNYIDFQYMVLLPKDIKLTDKYVWYDVKRYPILVPNHHNNLIENGFRSLKIKNYA